MSDADAMAGRLRFGDGSISTTGVSVNGSILARSGDVVLLGANVNTGVDALVQAPNGNAILAAGQQVDITGRGLEGIRLQVQAPSDSAINLGTLKGDAVGMFAGTLKHSGLIQATTATLEGGRVVLRSSGDASVDGASRILASGLMGGSVDVLGNRVAITDQASIDVSGLQGGGSIRVGGDYQGNNPELQNASRTYLGAGAVLNADSLQSGEGGRVIVWSDEQTKAYGVISAKGGALSGNGGFVEVSGKKKLAFDAKVNTLAPNGKAGILLLDPDQIDVQIGGSAAITDVDQFADLPGSTQTISPATLNAVAGNVVLQATNDINFNDPVNLATSGASLTAQAGGVIGVNGTITTNGGNVLLTTDATGGNGGAVYVGAAITSGGGNITLHTDGSDVGGNGIQLSANVNAGSGTVALQAPTARVEQLSGGITSNAVTVTASGIVDLKGSNVVGSFAATISGNTQPASFWNTGNLSLGVISVLGDLDIKSNNGNITQSGSITTGGSGYSTFIDAGTGNITLTNSSNNLASAAVHLTGSGISFHSSGGLYVSALTRNGTHVLDLQTTGGALTIPSINIDTGTEDLTLAGASGFSTQGDLSGANITITDNSIYINNVLDASGALKLNGGSGGISQSSGTSQPSHLLASSLEAIAASGGSISLLNASNLVNTLKISKSGTEAVSYFNNGSLNFGVITAGGDLTVSTASGSNISQSGALTVGGLASIGAGPYGGGYGSLVLMNAGNDFNSVDLSGSQVSIKDANALTVSGLYSSSNALIQAGGNLQLSGYLNVEGPGDALKFVSGGTFNGSGGFIDLVGVGARWLAYLGAPGAGSFPTNAPPDFKQYNAVNGSAVIGSGNGVLYGIAPTLSASLSGSVNKIYDGTTDIDPSGALVGSLAGGLGADVLTSATGTPSSATLSDPNAGTGKLVTVTGNVSGVVTGYGDPVGTNKPVYGYQFNASGNIGTVAQALATINLSGSRVYDGTNIVNANIFSLGGLAPGETLGLTGAGTVADRNVGADKLVTIGTLTLTNGTGLASNYTLIGGTHVASITVRPLSTWIGGASGAWNNAANWDALPDGNNVLAVSIPVGSAVAFDSTLGKLKLNSLTGGGSLSLTGGSLSVASAVNVAQFSMTGGALDVDGAMSVTSSYNQTGGTVVTTGPVTVVQTAGNMLVGAISAPSISLTANNGAISQSGPLVTGPLITQSSSGTVLTDAGNKVSSFTANNTGTGNIALTNVGVLAIPSITNNIGDITINNIGGITTVGAVKTTTGSITGVANSPLTIGAGGVSASGNVTLTATNLTSSGNLTLNGPVNSTGGSVALAAASNYVQNGTISAAQGVTATAGGEMTFGPNAFTSGNPVSFTANGQPVIAPGTASPGSAPIDFVATFMDKFEQAVIAQNTATDDLGDPNKKTKGDLVVEGQSCTR